MKFEFQGQGDGMVVWTLKPYKHVLRMVNLLQPRT